MRKGNQACCTGTVLFHEELLGCPLCLADRTPSHRLRVVDGEQHRLSSPKRSCLQEPGRLVALPETRAAAFGYDCSHPHARELRRIDVADLRQRGGLRRRGNGERKGCEECEDGAHHASPSQADGVSSTPLAASFARKPGLRPVERSGSI